MMPCQNLPSIIQGGMGAGVSTWPLASAVSRRGQLGVVSGTATSYIMTARLREGDVSGNMREALAAFPFAEPVRHVLKRYFQPEGRTPGQMYRAHPMHSVRPSLFLDRLTAIANFAEIHLSKRGHQGVVGLNLLEKIQMPILASLYGAMLAGVDYILMGAGIPTQVAGILDKLSRHEPVRYRLDVKNAGTDDDTAVEFDPERVFPGAAEAFGPLKRPRFLPIISSAVLGTALIRRSEGSVDGFVVELPVAGGHNSPPRGRPILSEEGEPVYGDKDRVSFEDIARLDRPFWLAGGYGKPGGLDMAREVGASGIQVGTAFSLCRESGIEAGLKGRILEMVRQGTASVFTSPRMSPTGFPFKVAQVPGTMSEKAVYGARPRICDVGLLRTLVKNDKGQVEYRCPSEPIDDYTRKGGAIEDTTGRTCLCNNLLATVGVAKPRKSGYVEQPIVTSGDDLPLMDRFLKDGETSFSAGDVIDVLLADM